MNSKGCWFRLGAKAGIPICLGYFAVSFALGIAARQANMSALQATIMSLTCVTSTGEYAAITLIGAGAAYLEMAVTQAIVNMRYLLMSTALTQKLSPQMPAWNRFLLPLCVTDELFGISVAVDGTLDPTYTYGAAIVSVSGWCLGTCLGVILGNILPTRVVSALSVALFAMFVAIVVPPAKKSRPIAGMVLAAMLLSWLFTVVPFLGAISSGFRIILITVLVSALGAAFFPVKEDAENA